MNQVYETEIRQMIADVMRDTGIRIDADDPIVAMLFAQKRELAQFLQQSNQAEAEHHKQFLAIFKAHSDDIISAATELQSQKQQLLAEILQANAKERHELEQKLFAQVSQRVQTQFNEMTNNLFNSLAKRTFYLIVIVLVIQISLLIAF